MGEILIDFIVTDGATSLESAETFVARSGGAPANAAVALARLGLASAFCGVVGDDQFGSRLRRASGGRRRYAHVCGRAGRRRRPWPLPGRIRAWRWPLLALAGRRRTALTRSRREAAGIAEPGALVVGSVALVRRASAERDRSRGRACPRGRRTGRLRRQFATDPLVRSASARRACEEVARRSASGEAQP